MMRKLSVSLSLMAALCFGCGTSGTLSKTDAAMVGALGGAAIGAATHKCYKTSARDAAIYGAIAGGIIGYVLGDDSQHRHTVNADTEYQVRTKDGKVIHVREGWYTVDSQPAPRR